MGSSDDPLPNPIPTREIIERPSSTEQKMRAIKKQKTIKEKKKQMEEKKKMEKLKKEKKTALNGIKGEFTFTYEGGLVGVKKPDMSRANNLQQTVPYAIV